MRLVWAVIPVFVIISLIGMQESFATIKSSQNDTEGWYLGEGLKKGDYFSYSLCHIDYKDCTEFEMDIWIKGDIQVGSETKWLAEVVVYDEHEITVGEMELGKISPEPTGGSKELKVYRDVFKSSVTWISAFSTLERDNEKWITPTWNWMMGPIAGSSFLPLATETITIPSGTWETAQVGWKSGGSTSKIWIVDDFPFPIKAHTFTHVSEGIPPPEYEFELLDYKENIQQSPFKNIVSTPLQENCDTNVEKEISIKKPTTNLDYQLHIFYEPEEPVQGCEIQFLIKFISKYDDTEFLNQVQYDFLLVDENLTPLRSIAEEEGRNLLYSPSGQVLFDFVVKEEPGTANYAVLIYGLAPEGIVPSTSADYLVIPVTISANDEKYDGTVSWMGCQIISGTIVESHSEQACQYNDKLLQIMPESVCGMALTSWTDPETGQTFQYNDTCNHPTIFNSVLDKEIPSPAKQLENNISPKEIICKEGLELIFKNNNSPACVKPSTAEKLIQHGWTNTITDETSDHSERWLIEYEYDMNSFPIDKLEKMFSGITTIYDEKFKIIKIESAFDYKNNLPEILQARTFTNYETLDNLFVITISGFWIDEKEKPEGMDEMNAILGIEDNEIRYPLTKNFESIEGVKSARHIGGTVGN